MAQAAPRVSGTYRFGTRIPENLQKSDGGGQIFRCSGLIFVSLTQDVVIPLRPGRPASASRPAMADGTAASLDTRGSPRVPTSSASRRETAAESRRVCQGLRPGV